MSSQSMRFALLFALPLFFAQSLSTPSFAYPPSRSEIENYQKTEATDLPPLEDLQLLRARLFQKVDELERQLSQEEFLEEIKKDNIKYEDPQLGRAELNMVDGYLFARIIHNNSDMAFMLWDRESNGIEGSRHFKQYKARQHIDAGENRWYGSVGRDLMVLFLDEEGKLKEKHYYPRHLKWMSYGFYRDWVLATWKAPTKGDWQLGIACALVQSVLAATFFGMEPAALSALFGFSIGVMASTYLNWRYRGPYWMQIAKSSVVSILFAGTLFMLNDEGFFANIVSESSQHNSAFNPRLIAMISMIGLNVIGNNINKVAWEGIPQYRRVARLNTKPLEITIPETMKDRLLKSIDRLQEKARDQLPHHLSTYIIQTLEKIRFEASRSYKTEINQASAENQTMYLVPFTGRLADIYIPIVGQIGFWSSIAVGDFLSAKYAERQSAQTEDEREKLQQVLKRWNRWKYISGYYLAKKVFRKLKAKPSDPCASSLAEMSQME